MPATITEAELNLCCHKATLCKGVRSLHAIVRRSAAELELTFQLDADLSLIRLSATSGSADATRLWQHTCFEAFVMVEGQYGYHEFNFAPSQEWRVYAFRGYRNSTPLTNVIQTPRIVVRTQAHWFELETHILLADLSAVHSGAPLRLALSAVIESDNGQLSFWALHHPSEKPDFHHPEAFGLRLEAPR